MKCSLYAGEPALRAGSAGNRAAWARFRGAALALFWALFWAPFWDLPSSAVRDANSARIHNAVDELGVRLVRSSLNLLLVLLVLLVRALGRRIRLLLLADDRQLDRSESTD